MTELPSSSKKYPTIEPSGLGEYIKRGNCPRYGTLRFDVEDVESDREWNEAFRQLNPILSHTGARFEEWVYEQLESCPLTEIIDSWSNWKNHGKNIQQLVKTIRKVGRQTEDSLPTLMEQVRFSGNIGEFFVAGDSDVLIAWPQEDNTVHVRVLDIKSSKEQKTHHQIQTACYTILLERVISEHISMVDVEIDAGVICRENDVKDIDSLRPDTVPSFNPDPRESDVRRLLQESGPLATELATEERPQHQFDSNCVGCPYNEVCYTEAVEESNIRILGLTRSEQRAFRNLGINTITEVAQFIDENCDESKPYEYELLEWNQEHKETVEALSNRYGLTESRIQSIAQQAQSYLGEITVYGEDEEEFNTASSEIAEYAHDAPWRPWRQSSGSGSLPDDTPSYNANLGYKEGTLVRVYMNIQQDFSRSRLLSIGAEIDCTKSDEVPISVSETVSDIPDPESKTATEEGKMLSNFIPKLYTRIKEVSDSLGETELPIHIYFYSAQERNALVEATERHNEDWAQSLRDLLSLRSGVDQSMSSIVKQEIETRQLKKQPSLGLLQAYERSYTDDEHSVDYSDWEYLRSGGKRVKLRKIFRLGIFDYSQPYTYDSDGSITIHFERVNNKSGFYPIQGRSGSQIPLEYFWGCKEIDKLSEDLSDNEAYTRVLESYKWHDRFEKETRISVKDINQLTEMFASVLKHIERSITYKNADVEKDTINVDNLLDFRIPTDNLVDACQEYQQLEFESSRGEQISKLQQSVKSRVLNGTAIPIRITKAQEGTTDSGYVQMEAEGELLYDELGFENPKSVAQSCKYASGEDGGGEWMVSSPLVETANGFVEESDAPQELLHSTEVTLEEFNPDNDRVLITAGEPFPPGEDSEFELFHKGWVVGEEDDDSSNDVRYMEGKEFILDSKIDDYSADKARMSLSVANDGNTAYELIKETVESDTLQTPEYNKKNVQDFIAKAQQALDIPPNQKQKSFITDVSSWVSLLQGPPGTGKTSGAVSTAIAARMHAKEKQDNSSVTGLVTGASNKSIDELLEDTAETISQWKESEITNTLESVALVRLTSKEPEETHDDVYYVNYHEEPLKTREIIQSVSSSGLSSLSKFGDAEHLILFATPARTYGIAKRVADTYDEAIQSDDGEITPKDIYGNSVETWFDLIAVDEGSMLPLPRFFLSASFIQRDGQLLVSGDHRQMPPVQKHEWDTEKRRTTVQYTPYLSVLDFFRLIRGEDVENTSEEAVYKDTNDIPITRLDTTYRCHTVIADFLQKWVYSKDNIEYSSSQTQKIPNPTAPTSEGISTVLEPESPLSLVLHTDDSSKQSNYIEAEIISEIIESLPSDQSVGVVTPHNAQKGLVSNLTEDEVNVDTVERFQGGQRDVMILSATVSDPDYIEAEEDFLMDLRRINVAISRMKKKLIVIAPETIFEVLPDEPEQYEESLIWKGIYDEVDATGKPEWSGPASEITPLKETKMNQTEVRVETYNTQTS